MACVDILVISYKTTIVLTKSIVSVTTKTLISTCVVIVAVILIACWHVISAGYDRLHNCFRCYTRDTVVIDILFVTSFRNYFTLGA